MIFYTCTCTCRRKERRSDGSANGFTVTTTPEQKLFQATQLQLVTYPWLDHFIWGNVKSMSQLSICIIDFFVIGFFHFVSDVKNRIFPRFCCCCLFRIYCTGVIPSKNDTRKMVNFIVSMWKQCVLKLEIYCSAWN